MNDYFTFFYVKHFELPMCMKCAIQINLPCLALPCLSDNSYISYMGLCICFIYFKMNSFFCKALLETVFPVIAIQRFDFKNSIIAIQLFLMILNLHLSSA